MQLNVAKRALDLLKSLKQNGFKSFYPHLITKESTWHREYAIFIIEFILPYSSDFSDPDCEYCVPGYFDQYKFNRDLEKFISDEFPGCTVTANHTTHEFEIVGPNHNSFYKEHADKLEEIACETLGWSLYDN